MSKSRTPFTKEQLLPQEEMLEVLKKKEIYLLEFLKKLHFKKNVFV